MIKTTAFVLLLISVLSLNVVLAQIKLNFKPAHAAPRPEFIGTYKNMDYYVLSDELNMKNIDAVNYCKSFRPNGGLVNATADEIDFLSKRYTVGLFSNRPAHVNKANGQSKSGDSCKAIDSQTDSATTQNCNAILPAICGYPASAENRELYE